MKFYNNIVSSRSGLKLQSSANETLSQATTKPAAPVPVTKSQLQAAFRASQSPVVQNAIIEWNKFNKIVRTLTRSTKVIIYQCNYYVIIIIYMHIIIVAWFGWIPSVCRNND